MIKKWYSAKRKKLREELLIGEKVLVLAERIKKKAAPGKFHQQSAQNISYFNKERAFIIRTIQPIDGMKYYWLNDAQNNSKLTKGFQRTELFAIRGNFVMWLHISLWFIISIKQKYYIHNWNVIDKINDFLSQNQTFPCF